MLENISRKRKEGGLDLVSLKERIQSIKGKAMTAAESQIPETDYLMYAVGTKQKLIYGKIFLGPKMESSSTKRIEKLFTTSRERRKSSKTTKLEKRNQQQSIIKTSSSPK